MRTLIFIVLMSGILSPAYATFQIPEEVEYKNMHYVTLEEPLTIYFLENEIEIYKITQSLCTANWRGYVANWKIEDGYLYLERLFTNPCETKTQVPLTKLFPEAEDRVKALWYSGKIPLFKEGDLYGNKTPEHILNIRNGRVIEH